MQQIQRRSLRILIGSGVACAFMNSIVALASVEATGPKSDLEALEVDTSIGLELVLRPSAQAPLEKVDYTIKRLDSGPIASDPRNFDGLLPSGIYEIQVSAQAYTPARAYFVAFPSRSSEVEVRTEAGGQLRIKQIVDVPQPRFIKGKVPLTKESLPILDELFDFLLDTPEIKTVEVAVHTDTGGKESANKKLTTDRAERIADYLVAAGLPRERVEAVGYGSAVPLVGYDQEGAKLANRRVEFVVKAVNLPLDAHPDIVGR